VRAVPRQARGRRRQVPPVPRHGAAGRVRQRPVPARRPRLWRPAGPPPPRRPRQGVRARAVPVPRRGVPLRRLHELLLHLAAAHGWPCFTKTSVGDIVSFTVELRHGFNFVRAAAGNGKGPYHLFLLNTAKEDAAP
jgi:hypothetical protein